MRPDHFEAWIAAHGATLQHELAARYGRANADDAWQTVMLHLYRGDKLVALDESRVSGYLYRACVKELAKQRRKQEREDKRIKALALLDGQSHPSDEEQVVIEQVLRALPQGALRTAAWLIYACEWPLPDAARCVGLTPKEFKAGWRAKAYRQARQQLAQFIRRRR